MSDPELPEESYAEGFFAAREKAAGIADKFDHDDPYTDCCGAEIAIAERIRAMSPTSTEDPNGQEGVGK